MDLSVVSERVIYPYLGSEAVDISSTDHAFSNGPARGLLVTASGDVIIRMLDGSEPVIPVVVPTSHFIELRGFLATHVIKTGTTATVAYGLL